MRKLTIEDIKWTVTCEEEYDPPEAHFASDNAELDREICEKIRSDLAWNKWAWTCVKVSGKWQGVKEITYLGACSYADENDFKGGGYFQDMQAEVLQAIQVRAERITGDMIEQAAM